MKNDVTNLTFSPKNSDKSILSSRKESKIESMDNNKVFLVGNVGRNPEVNYFSRNHAVARFTLATDNEDGTTEWHRVACTRFDLAQKAEQYVHTGTRLRVEGRLRYRDYVKDGQRMRLAEIETEQLSILDNNIVNHDKTEENA